MLNRKRTASEVCRPSSALPSLAIPFCLTLVSACDSSQSDGRSRLPNASSASATVIRQEMTTPASASPTSHGEDLCQRICSKTKSLKCGKIVGECVDYCNETLTTKTCQTELRRVYECFASHDADDFACGPDGLAAIREGLCDAEQGDFVACIGGAP